MGDYVRLILLMEKSGGKKKRKLAAMVHVIKLLP